MRFTRARHRHYLLLVPRDSISLTRGHLGRQPERGGSLKGKRSRAERGCRGYRPGPGGTQKPLLSASPGAAPVRRLWAAKKRNKGTRTEANRAACGAAAAAQAPPRCFYPSVSLGAGNGEGRRPRGPATCPLPPLPPARRPLSPGARCPAGRWPGPSRSVAPAGPRGWGRGGGPLRPHLPPTRRRRPGRYHGDRGGRLPPSARRGTVCGHRPGVLQARPTGSTE